MPYIDKTARVMLDEGTILPSEPGHLNYMITKLCIEYMDRKGLRYQTINDIVGALTCAKDEFQRRVTGNYEDSKIRTNGDCYPPTARLDP